VYINRSKRIRTETSKRRITCKRLKLGWEGAQCEPIDLAKAPGAAYC
jgi:hypothetical protein